MREMRLWRQAEAGSRHRHGLQYTTRGAVVTAVGMWRSAVRTGTLCCVHCVPAEVGCVSCGAPRQTVLVLV